VKMFLKKEFKTVVENEVKKEIKKVVENSS
jgi:hypothetical protein